MYTGINHSHYNYTYYLSPQYISSALKMASTWRYTLVCLDGVMDISTTD